MNRIILSLVISLGIISCAGITHPAMSFHFLNKESIFRYPQKYCDRLSDTCLFASDDFGKVPVLLRIDQLEDNSFYYAITANFLVHDTDKTVTIHALTLVYQGKEIPLLDRPETFSFRDRVIIKNHPESLSTDDGGWYTYATYRDKEQYKRLHGRKVAYGTSIVRPINMLALFKQHAIDLDATQSYHTDTNAWVNMTYQLNDGETTTYTNKFSLSGGKATYTPKKE